MKRNEYLRAVVALALAAGVVVGCASSAKDLQPTLVEFKIRMEFTRGHLPSIVKAAEAAAAQLVANTNLLINVPYRSQQTFAEEILNRSGGLALALPPEERPKDVTDKDIVLFSMRSWQMPKDRLDKRLALLKEFKQKGWMIILFASSAGMPKEVAVDHLIDNGAKTPGESEAPVNTLANIMNVWLWNSEFAAALTRKGKCTGILMSILEDGSDEHNRSIQSRPGRHWMGDCSTQVAALESSAVYLRELDKIIAAVSSDRIQAQIDKAADLIASQIAGGRKVGVTSCCHILLAEIFAANKTPWRAFNVVWQTKNGAFEKNIGKDDLLIWFGYAGMSTPYEDYGGAIRKLDTRYITCFRQDAKHPENNEANPVVHIEQSWTNIDAVVAIPYAPGRMAPVSGLNQGLLYRMLDDEASARLAAKSKAGAAGVKH